GSADGGLPATTRYETVNAVRSEMGGEGSQVGVGQRHLELRDGGTGGLQSVRPIGGRHANRSDTRDRAAARRGHGGQLGGTGVCVVYWVLGAAGHGNPAPSSPLLRRATMCVTTPGDRGRR